MLVALMFCFIPTISLANSEENQIIDKSVYENINYLDSSVEEELVWDEVESKLKTVNVCVVDVEDLKTGNNIIYSEDDIEVGIEILEDIATNSLDKNSIETAAIKSNPWSSGTIGSTATLRPHKTVGLSHISYQLDWRNYKIASVHSPSFSAGGLSMSNPYCKVIYSTARNGYASAIAGYTYELSQGGFSGGSSTNWLRIEINGNTQMRLVWDMG